MLALAALLMAIWMVMSVGPQPLASFHWLVEVVLPPKSGGASYPNVDTVTLRSIWPPAWLATSV